MRQLVIHAQRAQHVDGSRLAEVQAEIGRDRRVFSAMISTPAFNVVKAHVENASGRASAQGVAVQVNFFNIFDAVPLDGYADRADGPFRSPIFFFRDITVKLSPMPTIWWTVEN